ncbi:hypothetical protein CBS101457_004173 [Exobasidium rhododendri]|nr:hypothetical protein CBS101457_004173 [Exobasidium rhododendri]
MHLSSKTILITGGSAGIGLELAVQLYKKGNVVIITGKFAARLAEAKKREVGLITIQSDVADLHDVESLHSRIIGEYPNLDILINNAGIMRKVNLHHASSSLDTMMEEITINLVAAIRLSVLFLPLLKEQEEAAIVNVTSGLAFVPFPICPIYGASKAGLHSFSESLRVQLQNTSVRVIEVAPPQTKTELTKSFSDDSSSGAPEMSVVDLATAACKGIERNNELVLPGLAGVLRWMSRIAPGFILNQLSKSTVPKMLATENI